MSYSFQQPMNYEPQQMMSYESMGGYETIPQKRSSSAPYVALGVLGGGSIGAYKGFRSNPYISKDGEVNDSFVKKAYEKYINKYDKGSKEVYKEVGNVLDKVDGAKSSEELKKIMDSNKKASEKFFSNIGKTSKDFFKTVNKKNLESNKKVIKKSMNSLIQTKMQIMKNAIQTCWNPDTKKFEKAEGVSEDMFKSIKKSTIGGKVGKIAKLTAIGAAIGGVGVYVLAKLLSMKNNFSKQ